MNIIGRKVNGSTKSSRTIARGSHTSLHLYTVYGGSEIGHIYKKRTHAFCIIIRNTIEGNIDAGGIGSPDSHAGITYAIACIRIYYHGRHLI